ncbi:unnamed protein product [Clonostachys byssicola]|uniref:CorA-like transporter domain-containing protein n=1 Tax=Clonostachys byssicola TaxID=160290 RepID=A0A9N9UGZ7_9HYPO|nr:unnamed protein product [Clonostachys byssicola]
MHQDRLADGVGIQFEDEDMLKIPVRDIDDNGTATKRNLISIDVLRDWIGDTFEPDATNLTEGNGHVMPSLLEFLHAYGSESGKREVRFSGFRTEIDLGSTAIAIHSLGRSSDRFQVVYNLKAVSYDLDLDEINRVVIRQATIYHQVDIGTGKQLWILGDPSAKLKSIVGSKYGTNSNHRTQFENPFKASLDIHLMWTTWAISQWSLIIQIMDKKVDELSMTDNFDLEKSIAASMNPSKEVARLIEAYQRVMQETAAAANANCTTMTSLSRFYVNFRRAQNRLATFPKRAINSFVTEIDKNIHDMKLHHSHLLMLGSILKDSTASMQGTKCHNDKIREHLHMQATEEATKQQETISEKQKKLAKRQEAVSRSMWEQTLRNSQETSAMRIITIITLVYLPPTFVSVSASSFTYPLKEEEGKRPSENSAGEADLDYFFRLQTFFSTDIVKYQNGESYSALALGRWWSVTGPLMGVTLLIVGLWFMVESRWRKEERKQLEARYPGVFVEEVEERE